MAGNPIKYSDLFQDDGGLDKLLQKIQEVKKVYLEMQDSIMKKAQQLQGQGKQINVADPNSIKRIKELEEALRKLTEEKKKNGKALTEVERLQKKAIQLQSNEAKISADLKVQIQEKTRALKEDAKIANASVGAYTRLSAQLNKSRRRLKDLEVAEKGNTKEARRLRKEVETLDTKLKKVDASVGQFQRNVGNYTGAFQKLRGVMLQGLGALGITAGLAGLVRVMRNSIGIFASFEKANSTLRAVLGATAEEMEALQIQAKELGATTAFTATQVTELQIEFAKLGFPTEDIQNMTESTLNAAAAMGSDLAETAKLTGATLKAFKLESSEAARVNDVLARATTASALDFAKLSSSMSTIAPVANSFGFSLEGTVSLLGELSNAGFDASSAATATRKILLNLADSNGKLAKSLKEPVKDLPSLVRGLKQLKSEGINLGKALELTDVRSVAAFSTFLEGTDSVLKLNDALLDAEGTAARMADTQLDNLSGAVTILNSAWEGLILSVEDGSNSLGRFLKNVVKVVTEILSIASGTQKAKDQLTQYELKVRNAAEGIIRFTKVIAQLVIGFVAYKAGIVATTIAMKAHELWTKRSVVTTKLLELWNNRAALSFKTLNTTMMRNVFGIVAAAIAILVSKLKFFKEEVDNVNEAAKAAIDEENQRKALLESIKQRYAARAKLSKAALDQLKSDIQEELDREELAQGEIIAKNKRAREIIEKVIADSEKKIAKELEARKDIQYDFELEESVEIVEKENQFIKEQKKLLDKLIDPHNDIIELRKEQLDVLNGITKKIEGDQNNSLEDQKGLLEKINETIKALREEQEKSKDKERILEINEELEKQKKLREDLLGITAKKEEEARLKALEDYEKELEKAQKEEEESTKRLYDEIEKLNQEKNQELLTSDEAKERDAFNYARKLAREKIEAEIGDEKLKEEALRKFDEQTARQREAINKKYRDKEKEDELEAAKKAAEARKQLADKTVNQLFDQLDAVQDRQEELLEKQIEEQDKQVTAQQERASQGLENTLAFEEAERAKLEQKKLQAERRKIQLEKVKALYAAYSSAAGNDDKNAIATAIRDIGILAGLESGLTSLAQAGTGTGEYGTVGEFLDAKKNGSKGGNSLSGGIFRGESHARRGQGIPLLVEGGEGILSVNQMKALGSENFQYLTKALDGGYLGKDFFGDQYKLVPAVNNFNIDLSSLQGELREVKAAIENKPVQQVNVEQLSKTYTDFIETNIQGNKRNISRYRVNKPRL